MNTKRYLAIGLASLALAAGCATETDPPGAPGPTGAAQGALTASFEFDSSAIQKAPPAELPAAFLTLDRLDEFNVARSLLLSSDKPERVETIGTHETFKTPEWEFEKDSFNGRVAGLATTPEKDPSPQDEASLQKAALERLFAYGVGPGEIGRVLQRRSMRQDFDGQEPEKPELHRYKTFVFRGVNGVQIEGHRAVISQGLDGSPRKVAMKWPALSKKGHQLRTPLTPKEIEGRAAEALAREGEVGGKVSLFWKYVATNTGTGEVALRLTVGAHMRSVKGDVVTEEPRIVNVDISAQ